MQVARAIPLPAVVTGEAIVVLAGRASKKTDVPFTLRAAAPEAEPGLAQLCGRPGPRPAGGGGWLAWAGASGGPCYLHAPVFPCLALGTYAA